MGGKGGPLLSLRQNLPILVPFAMCNVHAEDFKIGVAVNSVNMIIAPTLTPHPTNFSKNFYFILIKILWAEHFFKRKSRLLFTYDDTPEGGGRGARGKFCRNEKY